jgi:hypothetical protein
MGDCNEAIINTSKLTKEGAIFFLCPVAMKNVKCCETCPYFTPIGNIFLKVTLDGKVIMIPREEEGD